MLDTPRSFALSLEEMKELQKTLEKKASAAPLVVPEGDGMDEFFNSSVEPSHDATLGPSSAPIVVVPQPDANGCFATPADGAKFMASFGIPQVPLNGKNPNIGGAGWQDKGSTDPAQIDAWTVQYPGCNFGSVGKAVVDGFYALETDSPKAREQFTKDTGLPTFGATLMIKSGEGRAHWWYIHTPESVGLANIGQSGAEGFSLRLHNEMCVSPGSIHPERKTQYSVIANGAPTPASAKLIEWFRTQRKETKIPPTLTGDRIPRGQHDTYLHSVAGKLRQIGMSEEKIYDNLVDMIEDRFDDYGDDYLDMAKKHSVNICKKPVGKDDTVLMGDRVAGEPSTEIPANTIGMTGEEVKTEISKHQADYDEVAEKADQKKEEGEDIPYPLHIWEGTPYYDFAIAAMGEGDRKNFIPASYFVNGLMTVVGAIAGHRIFPEFSPKMPAHFFTVLLSTIGGVGKNETLQWSKDCFEGTGLLYQCGTGGHKNIGAIYSDFGSARGAIDEFLINPSILQEYGELTTPLEKFSIQGSGTSFLDLMNNTYDSITPNWSKIKGTKMPSVLPTWINNSMLSATTLKRWFDKMGESNLETFIQRLNVVHTPEIRTVFRLCTPDVTHVRAKLMDRIGLLEEYKLIWNYSEEAFKIGEEWHASLTARISASINEEEIDISEVLGRIQVFAHRIVGHLALWKCEPPQTPNGPARPSFLDGVEGRVFPYLRKAEGPDKEWKVEISGQMMRDAIEAAEYLVKTRELLMPSEGHDVKAKIENLIKKWAIRLRYCRWPELKRRANLRKYSSREAVLCLRNVEHTGLLTVHTDPNNSSDERKWVVVWVGDGTKTRKWTEGRGGYREGSGGYNRKKSRNEDEDE